MALCGAGTVHRNGDAIRSCVVPIGAVSGAEITTIEGIGLGGLHPSDGRICPKPFYLG
jgi:isoquinoline 1-oxidoreductase alpha subunit